MSAIPSADVAGRDPAAPRPGCPPPRAAEEAAPETAAAGEFPEPREVPSFRRLSDAAFYRGPPACDTAAAPRRDVGTARRQSAEGAAPGGGDPAPPGRRGARPFLLAGLFAAGIATGVGVTDLLGDAPTGLRPPDAAMSRDDRDPAPAAAGVTERSSMMHRLERQIAQRRLDRPDGDNALDTYRRIAAQWPDDAPAAGRSLSAALWFSAEDARAAARWDEALHDLEMLKTLPAALPLSAGAPGEAGATGSCPPPVNGATGEPNALPRSSEGDSPGPPCAPSAAPAAPD